MRWFHQGDVIMTVSHGIRFYLETIGCSPPIKVWHPGVHTEKFTFNPEKKINKNHPIFLYFGRIDKEKNLESFIELDLPGEKWILGSGGDFLELKHKYGNSVQFFEISSQEEINQLIQKGDVFVFPSKFDTFGIVLVEANAAGLPCATFNEAGPREVIKNRVSGILHEDLTIASLECLELSPKDCHEQAQHFSIEASVKKFFSSLVPI
jgi:glycosyltransferase involved in cell wall biosynthesis